MSELYLTLRHRLEVVTDWVQLGTATMRKARKRTGLSREAIARKLYVSSKTYERWENRGAVPREHLSRVAEELRLEVEELPPTKVQVAAASGPAAEELAAAAKTIAEESARIRQTAEEIAALLARETQRRAPPARASKR